MTAPPASIPTRTTAEAYLAILKSRGVDVLYVGAGTDTAPVVEAYSRAEESGLDFPHGVVSVHENQAICMAHGYAMVSGKVPAVMLHVTVGTANAVCGLMNAARARTPILLTAGRTPLYESGRPGSRSSEIHWAQEMYDQAGMVRELVKWDYELRDGQNVEQVVDRALTVARAAPSGPVYLSLPREVLAAKKEDHELGRMPAVPVGPHPDPAAVKELARRLAAAEYPVVVAGLSGEDPETVRLLGDLCDRYAIGIVEAKITRYVNAPSEHRHHLGHDIPAVLKKADALLFLETDVPWVQNHGQPQPGAFVAHAGVDSLFTDLPLRSFPSDLSITATARALLQELDRELASLQDGEQGCAARRERLDVQARAWRAKVNQAVADDQQRGGPITKTFFSKCVDEARPDDAIIVNEYSLVREVMTFDRPGSYFSLPSAGGLGWGFPAALGAKQAEPSRPVIAILGDGAYMFGNPAACHQAAAMHDLPIVVLVYNNEAWDAVELATLGMYSAQHAAEVKKQRGRVPLSSLKPSPAFEQYAEASGGLGLRVTTREELPRAIKRAIDFSLKEKRLALVNVIGV